jgi:hypothetical protein
MKVFYGDQYLIYFLCEICLTEYGKLYSNAYIHIEIYIVQCRAVVPKIF